MATWKKVVVSGSDANLASLTLDTALTVENGGTGKTTLTDGGVLVGSGTGAITSLGQAINGQLVIGSTGADPVLATLTPGSNIEITNTAGSITIAATGLNSGTVTSVGTAGTVNGITLTGGPITTTGTVTLGGTLANIANSQLTNSSITIGSTSVPLGGTAATVAGLTLTGVQATGSFSGSFTGTSDLPDLVTGNGLTGGPYDGSLTRTFAVGAGTAITVGATTVGVSNAGITAVQLATSVAGAGLSGGAGTALAVNVDNTSLEITADILNVKALGITNAMLAGSIANNKLANSSITIGSTSVALGGTATTFAGLTLTGVQASGSFSGSFQGDGSNITGIASNLAIVGETGTGTIALKTQTLTVTGGEGINTVASGQTITISGEDASSSNKGIASFASSNFTATAGDVALSQDIAIVRDLTIGRNLTVQGTASFQNTTNLDVTDRFIRMASGSISGGDGGIAIQQTGNLDAEAFGWDSAVSRWGVTGSFDASQNLMVPDAFMSTVIQGAASDPTAVVSKYTKRGNIFAAADESIWIYS